MSTAKKRSQSKPSASYQLRQRCPDCHVDVHMEKRPRDDITATDLQFIDGYAGPIRRDATMIGTRPDTPETEHILPKLTRSDPVAIRSLGAIGSEGEPLLPHRKGNDEGVSYSQRTAPQSQGTVHRSESSLRAEGEQPMDTVSGPRLPSEAARPSISTSFSTDPVERNDVEMPQAAIGNEGVQSSKVSAAAAMSIATDEVTPLLGGSPRLDHKDLSPLHNVRDHPEYKYSKLVLKVTPGECATEAGSRAEGVEESPEASPIPALERRKTELIWRS